MTLIDPEIIHTDPLARFTSRDCPPVKINTGLFLVVGFNFHLYLNGDWLDWAGHADRPSDLESWYGVCDSVEQFVKRFGSTLESDPHGYCVSFTRVAKAEQPSAYGWRWCKWGPYVGEGEPTTEYLFDEPNFTEVFCFHVHKHDAQERDP